MKMTKPIIVFFVCLFLLTVCRAKAEYRRISAADAYEMMSKSKDFIILDARSQEEFNERRIEGATLIPDREVRNRAEKELPDKNKMIFVYCRSGGRSEIASRELVRLGYTKVYDFGGILNWPYETVSGRLDD